MGSGHAGISFNITGRPVAKGDEPNESLGIAMPGYFETMRIPLVAGRAFGEQDGVRGAPTIIVNRAFANKYFPGENPRSASTFKPVWVTTYSQHSVREIVGVVGDLRQAEGG